MKQAIARTVLIFLAALGGGCSLDLGGLDLAFSRARFGDSPPPSGPMSCEEMCEASYRPRNIADNVVWSCVSLCEKGYTVATRE